MSRQLSDKEVALAKAIKHAADLLCESILLEYSEQEAGYVVSTQLPDELSLQAVIRDTKTTLKLLEEEVLDIQHGLTLFTRSTLP